MSPLCEEPSLTFGKRGKKGKIRKLIKKAKVAFRCGMRLGGIAMPFGHWILEGGRSATIFVTIGVLDLLISTGDKDLTSFFLFLEGVLGESGWDRMGNV